MAENEGTKEIAEAIGRMESLKNRHWARFGEIVKEVEKTGFSKRYQVGDEYICATITASGITVETEVWAESEGGTYFTIYKITYSIA